MAESGSGQEKTEDPTSKKQEKTRGEGQVARSRELNTLVMLLVSGFGFLFLGGDIIDGLKQLLTSSFTIDRELLFDNSLLVPLFWEKISFAINILTPFFILMVIAAIAAPLPLSGWVFSLKALKPKLSKMDPIKGFKEKIFAWKGFVELLKSLVKFVIVSFVGYLLLTSKLPIFLTLGSKTLESATQQMGSELLWIFILLSTSLLLIAIADVPFQLWDFHRQQKMTKQEVKDEHKDSEGNPEMKGKIRNTQLELARRRMMEEVPKADVIVTNPTHFAVAIRYDQMNMSAPVVVAMGADLIALQIRRVAAANDVPILESPALARSLYYNSEIDQEIPAGLYLAIAQVLAYVYQLKQYQTDGGVEPQELNDLPIPDELRKDEI